MNPSLVWGPLLAALSCGCGASQASPKTTDKQETHSLESQLAAQVARYRQVLAADPENREAQRSPLDECLKLQPSYAECEYLLGEVEERFENAQAAAEHFTAAAGNDPEQLRYFRALSDLYQAAGQRSQAITVLHEAVKRTSHTAEDRYERAAMLVTLARLAGEQENASEQRQRLQQVEAVFDDIPEKSLFELVLIYATLPTTDAAETANDKTVQQLKERVDSACAKADLSKGSQQRCSSSSDLLKERSARADLEQTPPSLSSAQAPSPTTHAGRMSVSLPVPHIESRPLKTDGAYTVWGASYLFRHPARRDEVTTKAISVAGYITKSNVTQSIECLTLPKSKLKNHRCESVVPTFWLCDQPSDSEESCLRVMGVFPDVAATYSAARALKCTNSSEPLPISGAKWLVRGEYGLFYGSSARAADMDANMGILAFETRDELEAAPAANQATLLSNLSCTKSGQR